MDNRSLWLATRNGVVAMNGEDSGRYKAVENAAVIMDYPSALERVDGDRRFLSQQVTHFLKDCSLVSRSLKNAMKRKDFSEVRQLAHSLKGTVGNLSAFRAYEAASQLEVVCQEGCMESMREAVDLFVSELQLLRQVLLDMNLPSES